jgi:hypothetical protein
VTFEEHPLLLIVVIVLTVEGWNLAKAALRTAIRRRRQASEP